MKNYFNEMMTDGYELLIEDKVIWPYELSRTQKIELLEAALSYFEEIEEYEKCAILKKKIDRIQSLPKTRRGRPKGSKNKIKTVSEPVKSLKSKEF